MKLDEDATVAMLRKAIVARRRGSTLIVDVTVALADAQLARTACNAMMDSYLDHRMENRFIAATLSDAAFDRRSDARLLDRCEIATK
jgi:hypothetical protein